MAKVGITRIEEEYYKNNGLKSFSIRLRIRNSNEYMSLAGKRVEIVLFDSNNKESFKWSSLPGSENLLVLEENGVTGKITFQKISQWKIDVGLHRGDLDIYDLQDDEFLLTYQTLEFPVVQNVPKK